MTLFLGRVGDHTIAELPSGLRNLELDTKEIKSVLEKAFDRKQQQLLCGSAIVDSCSWGDQITSRHAARGKKYSVHSGICPDKVILLHDHNVGTSPRRVNEWRMTDELQSGRNQAIIVTVKCTYRRSSLESKVLKNVFKSIIVSSSLALALEEKGTKIHFL